MRDTAVDVSALVDRVSVSIDGECYALRHPGELSILERINVARWSEEVLTDAVSASVCLAQLCALVLMAPAKVREGLTDAHRAAIAQAFFASGQSDDEPHATPDTTGDAPAPSKRGDWAEHIPRLQRFYGGTAMHWLSDVPVVVVEAFTAMLPRLQAEESLQEAERMAVGAGNRSKDFTRDVTRRWAASAGIRRKAQPATMADLVAMGFEVVPDPTKGVPQ